MVLFFYDKNNQKASVLLIYIVLFCDTIKTSKASYFITRKHFSATIFYGTAFAYTLYQIKQIIKYRYKLKQ